MDKFAQEKAAARVKATNDLAELNGAKVYSAKIADVFVKHGIFDANLVAVQGQIDRAIEKAKNIAVRK